MGKLKETFIKHYNELLEKEMDKTQEELFLEYICGDADYSTVKDLPKCKSAVKFYNYIDDYLEKGQKNNNIKNVLRFLAFLYEKEGYEGLAECISDCVEYGYKGIKESDFFFEGSLLGVKHKIIYMLYQLNDQIHLDKIQKYTKECEVLFKDFPKEFEDIATSNPSPHVRLRAAVFIYFSDPKKYDKIIDEALKNLNVKEQDLTETIYNACTFTKFEQKGLCEALSVEWKRGPAHTTNRMAWNKHYMEEFLDPSLFSKDYPYCDNSPCENDFFSKVAKAINLDDLSLCAGVLAHSDKETELKYAAEFFKDYPSDYALKIFESASDSEFLDISTLEHYRCFFNLMKIDTQPIADAFNKAFFNIIDRKFKYGLCKADDDEKIEDDNENKPIYEASMEWLQTGEVSKLLWIAEDNQRVIVSDELNGQIYEVSSFAGHFAEKPVLKEKIRRYVQYLVFSSLVYDQARFIGSAMNEYNWDGETIADYCLNGYPVAPGNIVMMFYDDLLISDKERKIKDRYGKPFNIITEAMAATLLPMCKAYIAANKEVAYDFLATMPSNFIDCGIVIAYGQMPELDPAPFAHILQIKQKALRERVIGIIGNFPSVRPLLEELQSAKRKDIRDYADKALAVLENMNAFALPGQGVSKAKADESFDILEYAKKTQNKKADNLILTFTDPTKWPLVKYAEKNENVPLDVLKCYVYLYVSDKSMQRLFSAEKMRPFFAPEDMTALSKKLYEDWWASGNSWTYEDKVYFNGGDVKTKGVLTLLGIHGGAEGVKLLTKAVKDFDNVSRSAMAGDAVKALAVSQSTMALSTVDNMSRVYRNKLVRRVAGETIAAAAESMGITVDEMSDKIVPNLGLNERGEGEFDLGSTKLIVKLDNALKAMLYNSEGKLLKKFPDNKYVGGENEDNGLRGWTFDYELYEMRKSDFNLLKKELKTLVKIQTDRLELSLSKAREWDIAGFNELFIENPIMQKFASSLIFGIYKDGKLTDTFRYADDGSFSDINDESFNLPENAVIRLAHPIDMTAEQMKMWKTQLSDYEIKQPFLQLDRPLFDNSGITTTTYDECKGEAVTGYFIPRMLKFDWFIGGAGDGGGFYCIFFDDKVSGISACINFEGDYPYMSDITDCSPGIGSLTFYKTDCVTPSYNLNISEFDILKPVDVPKQVFSEVVYRVTQSINACRIKD